MTKFKVYAGHINTYKQSIAKLNKIDSLHPKYQIDNVLMKLEKYVIGNSTITISTQSPYVVRAVEVFSKQLDIEDEIQFYFIDFQGNIENIKNNETDDIYADLADPFIKLEYMSDEEEE